MKRSIFAGVIAAAVCLSGCSSSNDMTEKKESFFAMDTYITLTAYGENAETALSQAEERMAELEHLWSVTDKDSEIYAVNHAGGRPVTVSRDTAEIIAFALDMAEKTEGALEPTVYPILTAWGFTVGENRIPSEEEIEDLLGEVGYDRVIQNGDRVQVPDGMMLDLGSVGKGYAGDVIAEILRENGVTSALLDIGGNIQAVGGKPDGTGWKLGVRNPLGEGTLGVLTVHDRAVVTSGSYERYFIGEDGRRYGHIMDPATGYPAESGLASVTVIAEEGKLCDALSTSLYVMGREGAEEYWRQNQGFDMILVTEDGEIYLTEGIGTVFSPNENRKVHVISDEK